jgi:translation elongation factor EF-1alpha
MVAMEIPIGKVTHYFNKIGVAVLELSGELKVGDRILILGHTSECTQLVSSLEVEHQKIQSGGPGEEVALKVAEPVRRGDTVFKLPEGGEK